MSSVETFALERTACNTFAIPSVTSGVVADFSQDTIPLSDPVVTASRKITASVFVPKAVRVECQTRIQRIEKRSPPTSTPILNIVRLRLAGFEGT